MGNLVETDVSYNVNDTTNTAYHQRAWTTLWAMLRGVPRTTGKGLKMAYVQLGWTATLTYNTGGINVDLLSNLPDWTEILTVISEPVYNADAWEQAVFVDQNNTTAASRLMLMRVISTGAELADEHAMAAPPEVLVIGY